MYQRAPQTEIEKAVLFPELLPNINDVARVEIREKNEGITLTRKGDAWVLESGGGYPALFEKVKTTVVSIAKLRVLEGKTKNPGLYSKLGVEGIDDKNSRSILITLQDQAGNTIASIIIGKERVVRTGIGPASLYVRKPDAVQALLVEGDLDIAATVTSWVNPDIVNIASDRVREVIIEHPDGNRVDISRASTKEKAYTLADIPEGAKLTSQVTLNSMATALEDFRLEDVKAKGNPSTENSRTTTVKTFDGLVAMITTTKVGDKAYSTFSFAFDPSAVMADEGGDHERSNEEGQETEAANEEQQQIKLKKKEEVQEEVVALNKALSDWVFAIPDFKADILTKKLGDLVKSENQEAKSESLILPKQ
ncbi:MAG: DUF4340 domain-containing protein [Gammaproteobacteria bacterium]|nr:DUF4340 domain-containing protein [Gammaproteobacteria bacterium]